MNYVMSLDIEDFILLIDKAYEKREERKAWEMWLTKYEHMDEKNFIPFTKFYQVQKQPVHKRSAEDVLKEANEIREKIKKKHT